ncbi:WD40/YVTN/BNR-like repeat-containing protein [Salicibibacter kimchii]|uniref:WD40/YVTN/BNR-like repeat-containing protein n=1 Tax=Salicibibacter kimchii TaxID=2099786 RepID=UPI001D04D2DA|nr:hypothetical protein [Salicibibacter kimchii]
MMNEKSTPNVLLCLAADPTRPGRLYGRTFDDGLWISNDSGETWVPAGPGISHNRVMSVAVSPTEVKNGYHVVWAGTEPSGLFRSEDGGQTWADCPALLNLSSRSSWSIPPRPHMHHVRSVEPDIHDDNRIFVGIELGGVMKSEDKGAHWEDRKPNSQYESHALMTHPRVPGRIYEAAGGGYAESFDAGNTWQTVNNGLDTYNYLVDIAVDPGDADTMVASAAKGPYTAYNPSRANTILVRREKGGPWTPVYDGLPDAEGSAVFALASHSSEPGVFYAVNNLGFYMSHDVGRTWGKVPVEWPEHLQGKRIHGLAINI